MLVLSRNKGEQIVIGNNLVLTVVDIRGDRVRLGFEGPAEVPIHRMEVYHRLMEEEKRAENLAKEEVCNSL